MAPQPYHGPSWVHGGGGLVQRRPLAVPGGVRRDERVTVQGLDPASLQGDKAVCDVLAQMGARLHVTGDAGDRFLTAPSAPPRSTPGTIPDLVPVLAAVAAAIPGTTTITGAARLRLKEI